MSIPNILIIEDHKEYREAVCHFLELNHLPVQMIEASSGEEGVLLAREKKPDIVLLDFALGGINGLETARQIKKHLPKCSIIMLTIYDHKEIFRRDSDGAIRFFINKGDLYEQLVPVINRILGDSNKNKKQLLSKKG